MFKTCLLITPWNAGNALFHIIAIIKDSVHRRNIFSLYHQELQQLMGIGLSQRLHPLYGIDFHKLSDYVTVVTLLKLYWKHTCFKKCIHVNYHLRYKYIYSLICYTLWDGSGMRVLLIWLFFFWSLFHFSLFIGFVILFIMFSAPRFRQLDRWRFIRLYYYYYYYSITGKWGWSMF